MFSFVSLGKVKDEVGKGLGEGKGVQDMKVRKGKERGSGGARWVGGRRGT